MRQGREGLTARAPWLVAFAFGLLHGLGFAGALSEVGLPEGHVPLALLFFNIGVEIGQLLFIAAVLGSMALMRRIRADLAALGRLGGAICDWQHRHVLGHSTHGCVLTCPRRSNGGEGHDEKVHMTVSSPRPVLAGLMAVCLVSPAWAQDAGSPAKERLEQALPKPPYSPYADRDFPTRPFFGDTHLHTSFSMDAGAFGARLDAARCVPLRPG